jgi:hypothetical protein
LRGKSISAAQQVTVDSRRRIIRARGRQSFIRPAMPSQTEDCKP